MTSLRRQRGHVRRHLRPRATGQASRQLLRARLGEAPPRHEYELVCLNRPHRAVRGVLKHATPLHLDGTTAATTSLLLPRDGITILSLLYAGLTTEAIARQLDITTRTVQPGVDIACDTLQQVARVKELGLL